MTQPVTLPLWLFLLIVVFAAVTFASHFLFPSVRWFFRGRMERAVARLNTRLDRPIQPFKLLRRYDLIQRLIYDPEVTQAIVEHAREHGLREDVAFEQARRYAKEIVPSFSAYAYFKWGVWGAYQISDALFDLQASAPPDLAAPDPDTAVIFVMNHRSNMDYVLITQLAARHSTLSYAVGEWARVWPLTALIRMMGAYFIRRRDLDGLYRKILRRYVQMSTNSGVTQAIFPEGGLSLTGGLGAPKLGLLSYMVEGIDLSERDLIFVPVALNYDRVLEDTVLINAAKSGKRRFPVSKWKIARVVLRQIGIRLKGRYRRFGRAAVSYGKPLSLREFPELKTSPDDLGLALMQRLGDAIPILPVPLVATLLLDGPLTVDALEVAAEVRLADIPDGAAFLGDDVAGALKTGLAALEERKIIENGPAGWELTDQGFELAQFYANSIAHLEDGNAADA